MLEIPSIRVEMPIKRDSKVLLNFKTIGDLKREFSNLRFCKYIFLDPVDNLLKGSNPPDELPLVANAYITVAGEMEEIIRFSKELMPN